MDDIPKLTNEQWREHLERLTHYAAWKFLYYGWGKNSTIRESLGPRATSPEDIAQGIIVSVLEGRRRYNPKAYRDFMTFLRSAVDSEINNLSNLLEHKRKKPLLQKKHEDNISSAPMDFVTDELDPSRICISKDLVEKLKESLAPEFNKDELIRGFFDCLEADITVRRDIAKMLGVDEKQVDNTRKKLYRKIAKIVRR